jgi:wyosine [tRNA(Phe)-imidazoG37] synthetase (radical SAM superfamily)
MSLLFHDIIYGPVKSRRFGYSLGINLLPTKSKICSFNCIYCECGWNPNKTEENFTHSSDIFNQLEETLISIKKNNIPLDVLTYAGNGEPTLHPDFFNIAYNVFQLRNKYANGKKIVLLTNGTTIGKTTIQDSINYIDLPVFKIDSANPDTIKKINNPASYFLFDSYIKNLLNIKKPIAIQTMLLKGIVNNEPVDNTTNEEIQLLIEIYKKIKPIFVMLYSLDRKPPLSTLQKIETSQIEIIANLIKKAGITVKWV